MQKCFGCQHLCFNLLLVSIVCQALNGPILASSLEPLKRQDLFLPIDAKESTAETREARKGSHKGALRHGNISPCLRSLEK